MSSRGAPEALPRVSIAMPIYNEAESIERTLAAVLDQDYPQHLTEILVAESQSDDGTAERILRIIARHPHRCIRLLPNPVRTAGAAMNRIILQATGDIVVRVDGHVEIASDYVRQCVSALQNSDALNVGGYITAAVRSRWAGDRDRHRVFLGKRRRPLSKPPVRASRVCRHCSVRRVASRDSPSSRAVRLMARKRRLRVQRSDSRHGRANPASSCHQGRLFASALARRPGEAVLPLRQAEVSRHRAPSEAPQNSTVVPLILVSPASTRALDRLGSGLARASPAHTAGVLVRNWARVAAFGRPQEVARGRFDSARRIRPLCISVTGSERCSEWEHCSSSSERGRTVLCPELALIVWLLNTRPQSLRSLVSFLPTWMPRV